MLATEYNVSNLFTPNVNFLYCSSVSPNVNATGIFINESSNEALRVFDNLMAILGREKLRKMSQEEKLVQLKFLYFNIARIGEHNLRNFFQYTKIYNP